MHKLEASIDIWCFCSSGSQFLKRVSVICFAYGHIVGDMRLAVGSFIGLRNTKYFFDPFSWDIIAKRFVEQQKHNTTCLPKNRDDVMRNVLQCFLLSNI